MFDLRYPMAEKLEYVKQYAGDVYKGLILCLLALVLGLFYRATHNEAIFTVAFVFMACGVNDLFYSRVIGNLRRELRHAKALCWIRHS